MSKKSFIESVAVKSPCSEDWNEMQGTDKIRFCSHCAKNVNNLSEMTRKQASRLVRASNGNLCIRYIQDPTTKRPMFAEQLLQITRRRPSLAAGVMSASIALSSHAYAQETSPVPTPPPAIEQVKTASDGGTERPENKVGGITGTITDPNGVVIPNVTVEITNTQSNEKRSTTSNGEGGYSVTNLPVGRYEVSHINTYGFKRLTIVNVEVAAGTNTNLTASLEVSADVVLMGVVGYSVEYELPLSNAIMAEDIEEVRNLIIRGAKVNDKEKEDKSTPLFIAVEYGNPEIVELLLDFGAKVNARDKIKRTPLMRINGDTSPEEIATLLRFGAKVNLADKEGNTALILAAGSVNAEVLKALIDAGADVRAKNREGRTALMNAAENDDLEAVKLLLEAGAEVNVRDKEGDSAWDLTSSDDVEKLLETYGAETKGDEEDETVIPISTASRQEEGEIELDDQP